MGDFLLVKLAEDAPSQGFRCCVLGVLESGFGLRGGLGAQEVATLNPKP